MEFQHHGECIDSQMRKLDPRRFSSVMDSKSGKILARLHLNRFNPSRIRKRRYGSIKSRFYRGNL